MKVLRCYIERSTDNFAVSFLDMKEIIGYSIVPIPYVNKDNYYITDYKVQVLTKTLKSPVYLENTFNSVEDATKYISTLVKVKEDGI